MISKEEFTSKLDKYGIKYVISGPTIMVEGDKTLVFIFENNTLSSFISGYEMRRVYNVKEVVVDDDTISITEGSSRYEISM